MFSLPVVVCAPQAEDLLWRFQGDFRVGGFCWAVASGLVGDGHGWVLLVENHCSHQAP